MSKELLLVAEALSNEKGVKKEVVFEAIQAAIESATIRLMAEDVGIRVQLDPRTGDYETFRYWEIVADDAVEVPTKQMPISEARKHSSDIEIGEVIEESIPSIAFGRIAAQAARQVMLQKVREAERELIVEQYTNKLHQLIYGTVKKVTRDNIIIDLGGKAEAFMPRTEVLPNEMFRPNDRVRAYLYEVKSQVRGPQLYVSRTRAEMLIELFRLEVPEIGENIIEIKAAARDPGNRSKIAVKTNDGRIDPIGACIGMRGARVQAVSNELKGERVDIVLWDDNPAQLVINAMAPAEIASIVVDEESRAMDVAVPAGQLAQAIGRNGLNVRLANQLTGWQLNVMTVEEFEGKNKQEAQKSQAMFVETLAVEPTIAATLVEQGFTSIEEVAYVPEEELLAIEGFDAKIVKSLRNKADDTLLTRALVQGHAESESAEMLRALEGMDEALFSTLKNLEVKSIEDLADLAVHDLMEIEGMTEKRAAALIMKAREPWFK